MSTIVQIIPTEHPTIKTTGVRIDDDFKITYRTETGGAATDVQVNFSGLLTDQTFQGSPPIRQVRTAKVERTEQVIIELLVYHAPYEEDKVPPAGMYWYNIKNHYPFDGPPEQGKTRAPDPAFTTENQNFNHPNGITIFNESAIDPGWTTGNTIATSITQDSLFGQLGTVEARRRHLKSRLTAIIDDPNLPWIMAGTSIPVITQDSLTGIDNLEGNQVTAENILSRRQQLFTYRLEMLARAVSIDSNLNDHAKFNLINGEIDLPSADVFSKISLTTAGDIANTAARIGWRFRKVSSVGGSPNYEYVKPTGNTWSTTYDATIDIGTSAPVAVLNWVQWIKS